MAQIKQLSPHFSLSELVFSSTAVAHGIDNTPPPDALKALTVLALSLEKVRALLNAPLHIDSGYRCPDLNRIVRGVPDSAHISGYAADFTCEAFGSPLDIVRRLADFPTLHFDQVIQEGTWVHFSVAPPLRQQILTAHFVDGVAQYQKGIAS